ncbi:hypothetical protein FA048_13095 [Pedobacter polaris]|uniref:Uncharacterized protein n=1 Tax=Pedobacter polaris TaxID=2571273 RepID=A0A4U1CR54_9SPHI|nr:hypothetical protein [Pedobacter polaris]TKC08091.1 hypothetical protein FA048_13095 [Pedobacter polaris]
MKKIIFTLIAFIFSIAVYAQKILPEIKVGTVLHCSAYVEGQAYPLLLTIKSMSGPVSIAWAVNGYGEGTFEMTAKSLESGSKVYVPTQPASGATKLSDEETFGIISKTAYKSLIDKKAFPYSGINFKIKASDSSPMKLGGKEVDATHVVSEDGKMELWILNNAAFPIILQSVGLTTDIVVSEIK